MNRFGIASAFVLTVTLMACGGNPTTVTPPPTPPPPAAPLVTPVGSSIGTPVTQTIGSSGGAVAAGGVKLEVLAGTVSSANITLQPIEDTLNGAGQGIAISSDAAWSKYAKISFPISPSDDNPEGLGLAVQQADGSWRSLEPVKVDVAAGTITAGLDAVIGTSSTGRVRTQGGLNLRSVVKFNSFYLKPSKVTVKVGATQGLTAYAQVVQNIKKDPKCGVAPPIGADDLTPLCQLREVTREYPFTNDKDGFTRAWLVNGVLGGNSTVGTVTKNGGSGAIYTAPTKKPSPDTVTVTFQSVNIDTLDSVAPIASVKITDDVIQTYSGSLSFSGSNSAGVSYTGQGNVTWSLVEDLPNDLAKYEATGSLQATTTYEDCTPAAASVPVAGTMIVYDPVRGGAGDPFASKYWFALFSSASILATAQCGTPPKATQVPVTFQATIACPEVPTLPTAPTYLDIALLESSGSWPCSVFSTTANWSLKAQ